MVRFIQSVGLQSFTPPSKLAAAIVLMLCATIGRAQPRVTWAVEGNTEVGWNMSDGRAVWVNLLSAGIDVGLWKGAHLEGEAISTYTTNKNVSDNLLGFSNIYTPTNKAFRLIQASLGQHFGQWAYVSVGLRNIDTDYFTSPSTSLFTAPADADFPTLSNNYPLATYPMAALGIRIEAYPVNGLTVKASIYNGAADESLKRQFRVKPGHDGYFSIGSVTYERENHGENPASYTIGYIAGRAPGDGDDEGLVGKSGLWLLVEQPFMYVGTTQWCLLMQGSVMTRYTKNTHGYWGTGLTVNGIGKRNIQAGVAVNRMHDRTGNELDAETTCLVPLNDWLSVQPAMHFIRSHSREIVVGMLRFSVAFGNK